MNEIENSDEQSVTIIREENTISDILKNPGIVKDTMDWVNGAVAEYYGKEKVSVE